MEPIIIAIIVVVVVIAFAFCLYACSRAKNSDPTDPHQQNPSSQFHPYPTQISNNINGKYFQIIIL